jgi:hypothetical protein
LITVQSVEVKRLAGLVRRGLPKAGGFDRPRRGCYSRAGRKACRHGTLPAASARPDWCFRSRFCDTRTTEAGIKIKLHGQPSKVLSILLEHSGQVVTRESYPEDSGRAIPSSISNTAWRSARYGRPRATPPTVRATLRLFPDADIALSQKPPWSVEVRSTSWHLLPVIRPRQKPMIRLRL